MRYLIIATCISLVIGCTATKQTSSHLSILNGTWTPTKQEIGGKELPPIYYQNQKLVIDDTTYILGAESVDKGTLDYKNGQMDIYGKEGVNAGKHFTAIYKLENEQLTICYNITGNGYPTGFETSSRPGLFLSVFKKN